MLGTRMKVGGAGVSIYIVLTCIDMDTRGYAFKILSSNLFTMS